ncbi:uncharacterized protein METZ01_LOCUS494639, partial [marine metagenome]
VKVKDVINLVLDESATGRLRFVTLSKLVEEIWDNRC